MTKAGRTTLALVAVAAAAVAVVSGGSAAPQATVTIGWAYDGVGNMAAYDGPALATAKEASWDQEGQPSEGGRA